MSTNPPLPIRPNRPVYGASAVLLPFADDGRVDWDGFDRLVEGTFAAGLVPAVNMDTGYANLIDEATRAAVLDRLGATARPFIAGAFVGDRAGDGFDADAYRTGVAAICESGGTPILFQSFGLCSLRDAALADAYAGFGDEFGDFLAFELGEAFAPFGRIYSLDEYARLLDIPQCIGAKHSSLSRMAEWDRLRLRDERRPDFRVLTGNDLAIDMVIYGSDYLLGLSAFHPAAFAARDALWAAGDPAFYELNDWLQYLGFIAFRDPVPAYKHSAARFLSLRGLVASDQTHQDSPERPPFDRDLLEPILAEIERRIPAN